MDANAQDLLLSARAQAMTQQPLPHLVGVTGPAPTLCGSRDKTTMDILTHETNPIVVANALSAYMPLALMFDPHYTHKLAHIVTQRHNNVLTGMTAGGSAMWWAHVLIHMGEMGLELASMMPLCIREAIVTYARQAGLQGAWRDMPPELAAKMWLVAGATKLYGYGQLVSYMPTGLGLPMDIDADTTAVAKALRKFSHPVAKAIRLAWAPVKTQARFVLRGGSMHTTNMAALYMVGNAGGMAKALALGDVLLDIAQTKGLRRDVVLGWMTLGNKAELWDLWVEPMVSEFPVDGHHYTHALAPLAFMYRTPSRRFVGGNVDLARRPFCTSGGVVVQSPKWQHFAAKEIQRWRNA